MNFSSDIFFCRTPFRPHKVKCVEGGTGFLCTRTGLHSICFPFDDVAQKTYYSGCACYETKCRFNKYIITYRKVFCFIFVRNKKEKLVFCYSKDKP